MKFKNTAESYGVLSKSFHWVMALLVVGMLCLGLLMDDISPITTKIQAYNLHKSFGLLVLTLGLCRIAWHVYSRRPKMVAGMKKIEMLAAHTVHYFLYIAIIGMPLSGWMFSSAVGRSVEFFKLFTLPDLVEKNQALADTLSTVHEFLGYTLIGAIAAHAAAALKHHFINKDATLKRMLP